PAETHEFRVIPAPRKGERVPGLTTDDARMANTLTGLLNEMAVAGWEYVRADTLPNQVSADPSGTSPKTMTLLVFRRPLAIGQEVAASAPLLLTEPQFATG
ncbi:MAG: DUF4177 domain-containing protein, partial [Pseudomonadota bacterium]